MKLHDIAKQIYLDNQKSINKLFPVINCKVNLIFVELMIQADEILEDFDWLDMDETSNTVILHDKLVSGGIAPKEAFQTVGFVVENFEIIIEKVKKKKNTREITATWRPSVDQ